MKIYIVTLQLKIKGKPTSKYKVKAWRADVAVRRALRNEKESSILKMKISVCLDPYQKW